MTSKNKKDYDIDQLFKTQEEEDDDSYIDMDDPCWVLDEFGVPRDPDCDQRRKAKMTSKNKKDYDIDQLFKTQEEEDDDSYIDMDDPCWVLDEFGVQRDINYPSPICDDYLYDCDQRRKAKATFEKEKDFDTDELYYD